MGYRDDFYREELIVGYTGDDVFSDPTVYFMSADEFGHITQAHDVAANLGREPVLRRINYTFQNELWNENCLVERIAGKIIHESRRPFVAVAQGEPEMMFLVKSIAKFTERKPGAVLSDEALRASQDLGIL